MRIARLAVSLFGLLFAALGLSFWLAPEVAAHRYHLAAVGTAGYSALRADVGGLFIALAVLCLAGAWTRRRPLLIAAAAAIGAVVVGRTIALLAARGANADVPAFIIELGAIAALWFYARSLQTPSAPAHQSRRRVLVIGTAVSVVLISIIAAALSHRVQAALFDAGARRLVQTNPALMND